MATRGGVRLTASGPPPAHVEREVPIKLVYLGRAMILREHVGAGTLGDKKVSLSLALSQPVGSLIAECDGQYVAIDLESFMRAACALIEEQAKEKGDGH